MTTVASRDVRFALNEEAMKVGLEKAPQSVYFWLHFAFVRFLERHRTELKKHRLFRGRSSKIPLGDLNKPTPPGRRGGKAPGVNYALTPADKRAPGAPIGSLHAEIYTTSTALETQFQGGVIKPRRAKYLAIPIQLPGEKRFRVGPKRFRRRLRKSSRLITLRSPSGKLYIAERQRKRGASRQRTERTKSGKARAKQRGVFQDSIIPRYALAKSVRIKPQGGFYEAWDRQAPLRAKILAEHSGKLLRQIANGIVA